MSLKIKDQGLKIWNLRFVICLIFGIWVLIFVGNTTASAKPVSPQGITVSPAFTQMKITQTETEHPLQFKVTNNEPKEQTLKLSAADFNTLDESGGLLFVGSNPSALQKKYGLANWIRLPEDTVTVPAKQTVTVNATILNQPDLAAGGHYGALMFSLPVNDSGDAQNKIAVHPIASSLLFTTKVGGETYKLKLADVNDNHSVFKLPSSITLRFKNDGNTHLIPRGVVTLTDPRGRIVSKGIINADSGIILPETYRRYSVPFNKIVTASIPGKYKMTVNYRFDGYEQFRTYQSSQILLTPGGFLVILGLLITATLVTFFVLRNGLHKTGFSKIKKHLKK